MKTSLWIIIFAVIVFVVLGAWYFNKLAAPSVRPTTQAVEVASSSLPATSDPCVADGNIKTGVDQWKNTLYFLCFQLNSSTVSFNSSGTLSVFSGDDGQFEGGEFEVIIRPSELSIPAPDSCKGIIARMPWTLYTQSPDAKANIAAKQVLYNQILALKSDAGGHVNVVLELSPYVAVVQANPLKLQLTQCNVFFRDVTGRYTPSLN